MTLEGFLKERYNYSSDAKDFIKSYVEEWKGWYKGNVRRFHNYYIYNGQRKVKQKRYTMNMAKEISEDWADILWSEKCYVELNNEEQKNNFEKLANDLNMYVVVNQAIEKSGAVGTCAIVVSAYDLMYNQDKMTIDTSNAKLKLDIIDVDNIYPLSWNNSGITECAFANEQYVDGIKYVVLSVHKLEDGGTYVIKNHLFQANKNNLTELTSNDTLQEIKIKEKIKPFSIFKPLLTNNICNDSPFGIPYIANAIDNIRIVDLSFDCLRTEVQDGKRRTFVRADMLSYEDGSQRMVFDAEDTSIYVLPKGATKDDLIQSDNADLRTDKLIATINTNLNILGNKVGFGENHYHFDGTNLSTATAVISSNSKMFRRKKRLEIGIEKSILDLTKAICYFATEYANYMFNIKNDEDIKVSFDDSIIEDKESESDRALREVQAGVLSKVEYRENIYGETTELATEKINAIKEDDPTIEQLVGTSNE